jgi:hypothetical protein
MEHVKSQEILWKSITNNHGLMFAKNGELSRSLFLIMEAIFENLCGRTGSSGATVDIHNWNTGGKPLDLEGYEA